MKNTKLIQFAQSFILLPVLSMTSASAQPIGPVVENNTAIVQEETPVTFLEKLNIPSGLSINGEDQEAKAAEELREKKAQAIDAYFKKYDMPLAGTGMKMVLEAEKNGIDWRLLPAIAVRESTGGKFACKRATHSFFGWGSCKINFESRDHAIEVVAKNLGGNNPNTDHFYAGKSVKEILQKYNPPSVVPNYAPQVMKIMDNIGSAEFTLDAKTTS